MDTDYEALLPDPQTQIHRLLQFLDYRSSVGSASSPRSRLEPLIEALGDLAPGD